MSERAEMSAKASTSASTMEPTNNAQQTGNV